MTSAQIVTPTDKALYGSQIPFVIQAFDTYGNTIEQSLTTYRLTASTGTIIANDNTATSVDLQRFDPTDNYYLDLTKVSPSVKEITLALDPVDANTGTVAPRASKKITLTSGIFGMKQDKQTVSHIDVTLPESSESYVLSNNGVAQLQDKNIPKIILTLTSPDGKPLDTNGVISSTQGLLTP